MMNKKQRIRLKRLQQELNRQSQKVKKALKFAGTTTGRLSSKETGVQNVPRHLDEKGPFTRPTAPADPKPAFFTHRSNPNGRFED
jgi:DNA polymerase I-like protein with 3'-5' exonuclease and polymerase domains